MAFEDDLADAKLDVDNLTRSLSRLIQKVRPIQLIIGLEPWLTERALNELIMAYRDAVHVRVALEQFERHGLHEDVTDAVRWHEKREEKF